jgi:hypothetical protein
MHTATPHVPYGRQELRVHVTPLWVLARDPYLARCELRRRHRAWELCVFIDDEMLLSRQCVTQSEAGALSAGWQTRLSAAGWSPPGEWTSVDLQAAAITVRPASDRRRPDSPGRL